MLGTKKIFEIFYQILRIHRTPKTSKTVLNGTNESETKAQNVNVCFESASYILRNTEKHQKFDGIAY